MRKLLSQSACVVALLTIHDAIATYARALVSAQRATGSASDQLDPTWGEPELLMNLAFAHLNHATPNRTTAEQFARQALERVPHWRYVREILLPQIVTPG